MRYLGGQLRKIEQIKAEIMHSHPKAAIFLERGFTDPFSGSGVVAAAFANDTPVTAGDSAKFAYFFSLLALNTKDLSARVKEVNQVVNDVQDTDFEQNFVLNYGHNVRYFTAENASRIAKYRHLVKDDPLLMALLLERVIATANIRLLFDAPFKIEFNQAPLELKAIAPLSEDNFGTVYHQDFMETVNLAKGGILYLNPPSSYKDYNHYYHLLDTIIEGRTGKIVDRAGRLSENTERSVWSSMETAKKALYEILLSNKADFIVLTYSKNGILSLQEIETGLLRNGNPRTLNKIDLGNEMMFTIENKENKWGF